MLIGALTLHSVSPALLQPLGSLGLQELRLPSSRHAATQIPRRHRYSSIIRALPLTAATQPPPQTGGCAAKAQG